MFYRPEHQDSAGSFASEHRRSSFAAPQRRSSINSSNKRKLEKITDVEGLCKELRSTESKALKDRQHGLHDAMPVLIWAGAGTGKTWMMRHALHILSKPDDTEADDGGAGAASPMFTPPRAQPSLICDPTLDRASPSNLYVPLLIPIHRLASWRQMKKKTKKKKSDDFVESFIKDEYSRSADEARKAMLLDAYRSKRLIMLFDGLDEAPDLRDKFETFVVETLLEGQHRFCITSRPEGMIGRASRLQNDPRLANVELLPYNEAQQSQVLNTQLKGKPQEFVERLLEYTQYPIRSDAVFDRLNQGTDAEYFRALKSGKELDEFDDMRNARIGQEAPNGSDNPVTTTEELIAAAEAAAPVFEAFLHEVAEKGKRKPFTMPFAVYRDKEAMKVASYPSYPPRVLLLPPLKSPESIDRKANNDKYTERGGPAVSWVFDALRASFLCTKAEDVCFLIKFIMEHVKVVRRKNFFANPDQTKFRRISLTLMLEVPVAHTATDVEGGGDSGDGDGDAGANGDGTCTFVHYAELQIHIVEIFEVCDSSHGTYEFFRTLFAKTSTQSQMWMDQLGTYLSTWSSFLQTPVLMAMLAVVLQQVYKDANPKFENMPKSLAELYDKAISQIVARTLNRGTLLPPVPKTLKSIVENVGKLAAKGEPRKAISIENSKFAKDVWPYLHARRLLLEDGGWTIKRPAADGKPFKLKLPAEKSAEPGLAALQEMDKVRSSRDAGADAVPTDVNSMLRVLELVSFETMFTEDGAQKRVFKYADIYDAVCSSSSDAATAKSGMDALHLIMELCLHHRNVEGDGDGSTDKYIVPTLKLLSEPQTSPSKGPSHPDIFPPPGDVAEGRITAKVPPAGSPEATFQSVHTSIQEYLCVKHLGALVRANRTSGEGIQKVVERVVGGGGKGSGGKDDATPARWASAFINNPNHKNQVALATEDLLDELLLDVVMLDGSSVDAEAGTSASAGAGAGGAGTSGASGGDVEAWPQITGKTLDLTDTGAINFAECLKGNARWGQQNGDYDQCTLNLSASYKLRGAGKTAIFAALQVNSVLSKLIMRGIKLGGKGGMELAAALRTNHTLWHLDVRQSEITSKAAAAIGKALEHNRDTRLQQLLFGGNTFKDGTSALAGALANNLKFLTNQGGRNVKPRGLLQLQGSRRESPNIGPKGGLLLAQALSKRAGNMCLIRLNLKNNQLDFKCGLPLGKFLRGSTTIKYLFLGGNKLGCKGAEGLAKGLAANRSLLELDLEANNIGEKGKNALLGALPPSEEDVGGAAGGRSGGDGDGGGEQCQGRYTRPKLNLQLLFNNCTPVTRT